MINYATFIQSPKLPFFLFGLSLGGCVCLHTSLEIKTLPPEQRANYRGSVLFAPAIYDNVKPEPWMLSAMEVLNQVGLGNFGLGPAATEANMGGPEGYARFKNDKYCYSNGITLSLGAALLSLTREAAKKIPEVNFPFFVAHGVLDDVVLISGSRELIQNSKTLQKDKTLFEERHYGHDILTENALEYAREWMFLRT